MKAYLDSPKLKKEMVRLVNWHYDQDKIKQGTYGDGSNDSNYCAVGCSLHSLNIINKKEEYPTNDHSRYETELGIPRQIARLQDRIFEGLTKEEAKDFPAKFVKAVNVGADLSLVMPKFFVWLLADPEDGVIKYVSKYKKCEKAIKQVAKLYGEVVGGKTVTKIRWAKAKNAADAAYAAYAAYAVYAADAVYAAAAAAYAAADAAAAYAAADADAVYAADAAAAAAATRRTAREVHYSKMAKKLIEFLKETN